MIGKSIELWTYSLFNNQTLYIKEVLQKSYQAPNAAFSTAKNSVVITTEKKVAQTQAVINYTFEQHLTGKSQLIQDLARSVQEFVTGLDSSIEEVPRKILVAYRTTQNITTLRVHEEKISLHLKLNSSDVSGLEVAHKVASGYVDKDVMEIFIKSQTDLEATKPFIEMAYRKIGR